MKKNGFSLIELVITLALVIGISGLIFVSFNALNGRQTLDKQVDYIKSSLVNIRNDAVNAKGGTDHVFAFSSSTISVDGSIYTLPNNVSLASHTLSSKSVIFARLTGYPNATGTLVYQLKSGNTVVATSSIIINNLGIIEN